MKYLSGAMLILMTLALLADEPRALPRVVMADAKSSIVTAFDIEACTIQSSREWKRFVEKRAPGSALEQAQVDFRAETVVVVIQVERFKDTSVTYTAPKVENGRILVDQQETESAHPTVGKTTHLYVAAIAKIDLPLVITSGGDTVLELD
jgi:hypothetical protein